MDALTLVTLAALVWKAVDLVKNVTNRKWDPVLTQVVLWLGGIAVAFLAGAADDASKIKVWESTLGDLDGPSKILLGLALSSFAGVGYDAKKAIDGEESAEQPSLLPGSMGK